jgi:hypothetical protein
MPYRREAEVVLAIWREVEHDLEAAPERSDDAIRLLDEWARLRAEHLRLTDLAHEHDRPAPEPWPERRAVTAGRGAT